MNLYLMQNLLQLLICFSLKYAQLTGQSREMKVKIEWEIVMLGK